MSIRILLADDHVLVRQGVRALLEQAGMVVVGEAADGPEALRLADTHAPARGNTKKSAADNFVNLMSTRARKDQDNQRKIDTFSGEFPRKESTKTLLSGP